MVMGRTEVLELALRVLNSWTDSRYPDPEDLRVLRSYVPTADGDIEIDSLACEVIQRELRKTTLPVPKADTHVIG